VVVFEHNPRNLLTQMMVRRAPIDRHAVLLTPEEVADALSRSGLSAGRPEYLMFLPPRFGWSAAVERFLARIPFGGQYVMLGYKPSVDRTVEGHRRVD
jgi:hypothetical protein